MSGKYESIFFVFTSFFRGSRFTSIIFLCNFHCPVYTFIAFFYAHFVLSDNCFAWKQVGELHPRRSNKKRARPIDYCYTVVVFFFSLILRSFQLFDIRYFREKQKIFIINANAIIYDCTVNNGAVKFFEHVILQFFFVRSLTTYGHVLHLETVYERIFLFFKLRILPGYGHCCRLVFFVCVLIDGAKCVLIVSFYTCEWRLMRTDTKMYTMILYIAILIMRFGSIFLKTKPMKMTNEACIKIWSQWRWLDMIISTAVYIYFVLKLKKISFRVQNFLSMTS